MFMLEGENKIVFDRPHTLRKGNKNECWKTKQDQSRFPYTYVTLYYFTGHELFTWLDIPSKLSDLHVSHEQSCEGDWNT